MHNLPFSDEFQKGQAKILMFNKLRSIEKKVEITGAYDFRRYE